jgi:Trypsin-like peptidase domain
VPGSTRPWDLYQIARPALALVTGLTPDGDVVSGTAFHVGNGYFVTAAHLAALSEFAIQPEERMSERVEVRAVFRSDYGADVAIVETDFGEAEHLDLGSNWDDVGPDTLVGSPILLLGYPPIPRADGPVLVAAPGHIAAIISRYDGVGHLHYITSTTARGGFSGGPVIAGWGRERQPWVMAVHVESLLRDDQPRELGFAAAVSIEAAWNILDKHQIQCAGTAWLAKIEGQ